MTFWCFEMVPFKLIFLLAENCIMAIKWLGIQHVVWLFFSFKYKSDSWHCLLFLYVYFYPLFHGSNVVFVSILISLHYMCYWRLKHRMICGNVLRKKKKDNVFFTRCCLLGGIMLYNHLYHCARLHLKLPCKKGIILICEVRCVTVLDYILEELVCHLF